MAEIWIVVMDTGGIFGVYLGEEERAREAAKNIRGVLTKLPVLEDHRGT